MKNLFLVQVLRYIGRRLDGHKTTIGGISSVLMGILGVIGIMYPDAKSVELSLEASIAMISAGFAAIGMGGKLEKLKKEIKGEEHEKADNLP